MMLRLVLLYPDKKDCSGKESDGWNQTKKMERGMREVRSLRFWGDVLDLFDI